MLFALPCCPVTSNVVGLGELLDVYDPAFRRSVREALEDGGFELGGELPDLQLAAEIREVLGQTLGTLDQDWESLQLFLDWAEHQGILVDLGDQVARGTSSDSSGPQSADPGPYKLGLGIRG